MPALAGRLSDKSCDCLGDSTGRVYQNANGGSLTEGGCVSSGALVDQEAFIGPGSFVCENAEVTGRSRIKDGCVVTQYARVSDSECLGDAVVGGYSVVANRSRLFPGARIFGDDTTLDRVLVQKGVRINGGSYSNQTISKGVNLISPDEKQVMARMGSGAGKPAVDYLKLAAEKAKTLETQSKMSYSTPMLPLPSGYGGEFAEYPMAIERRLGGYNCTFLYVSSGWARYYNGPRGVAPRSTRIESIDSPKDLRLDVRTDLDIEHSRTYAKNLLAFDFPHLGTAGHARMPMIYVYELRLKNPMPYNLYLHEGYVRGNKSMNTSNRPVSRTSLDMYFLSASDRDQVVRAVEDWVNTCRRVPAK